MNNQPLTFNDRNQHQRAMMQRMGNNSNQSQSMGRPMGMGNQGPMIGPINPMGNMGGQGSMGNSAAMGSQMSNRMGSQMGNPMGSQMSGQMGSQMGNQMGSRGGMGYNGQQMMSQQQGMMMNQSMMMQSPMMGQQMNYQGYNDGYSGHIMQMAADTLNLQPIHVQGACLLPPPPDKPPRSCRERPPGCRTVFIGGLPDNSTERILGDIFSLIGPIFSIRQSKKNFAHIRYEQEASADYALKYSGWTLCINGEEGEVKKPIHVDYATARDDQAEHDERQKQYYRDLRRMMLGEEDQDTVVQYSDQEAAILQEQLRASDSFVGATAILLTWLERGDCTRRNAHYFYGMTQTAHSHVRRMASEKQQFEQEYNAMKDRFQMQIQTILVQFEQIEKVFEAAQKQKVWDHFTKAQRKNITAWHSAVQDARRENVEFALNQRQEDEMDLSDEDDQPQVKRARMGKSYHLQDAVTSLEEENDDLKNQLEAYKHEVESARREIDTDSVHKDSVVSFLRTALNNTQTKLLEAKNQVDVLKKEVERLGGNVADLDLTMKTETAPETQEDDQQAAEPIEEVEMDEDEETAEKSELVQDESKEKAVDKEEESSEEKADAEEESPSEKEKASVEKKESEAGEDEPSTRVSPKKTKSKATEKKEEQPKEESEMDKLIAQAMKYASQSDKPKPKPMMAAVPRTPRVRASGFKDKELKIVSVLSMFLNLHPFGASSDYICSYLNHLNLNISPLDLDILLLKLPMLFYNISNDENSAQSLWSFTGFQA